MIQKTKKAHNTIRTSTPGQVVDLPKPPDHIIVDMKPIKWINQPHGLNLSPNPNLILIPIGLTSWCKKKVKVGTHESVTYYAHAVDLAFAVWKCQGGTFDYIIALLEHTLVSPSLTFEKLYVMLPADVAEWGTDALSSWGQGFESWETPRLVY